MKKSEHIKDLQLTIKAISEELNNEVGDFVKKQTKNKIINQLMYKLICSNVFAKEKN